MYEESAQANHKHNGELHEDKSNMQRQVLRCANCDIEILWVPIIVEGTAYCCTGCAAGGPCNCDYSQYHAVNISGVIHYRPEAN